VDADRVQSFDGFVASRVGGFLRLGWLLTGDWARTDAALERALAQVWPRWPAADGAGVSPETAVRQAMIVGTSRKASPMSPQDVAGLTGLDRPGGPDVAELRRAVLAVLGSLPSAERAAVALAAAEPLAEWDAADALGVSSAEWLSLLADARRRAASLTPTAATALDAAAAAVPDVPFAADLAVRSRRRAQRGQRRRHLLSATVCLLVVAAVAVPVSLTSDGAPPRGDVGIVAPTRPGVPPAVVAERLVDPLPVPRTCIEPPDGASDPVFPLQTGAASAVWFRFCPADEREGIDVVPFAPDLTVVDSDLDRLVDSWLQADDLNTKLCGLQGYTFRPTVRMHVGTQDGMAHVIDLQVSSCGTVSVDGERLDAAGRAAFVRTLRLLGRAALQNVDEPGVPPADALRCPTRPEAVSTLAHTAVPDYPQVRGLSLPLPAVGAVLCRYLPPTDSAAATVEQRVLGALQAEQLRAAYLARYAERQPCIKAASGVRYGLVFLDPTGSRRVVTAGEPCVGPWLSELLYLSYQAM
jgi:hypothetical protein